MKYKLRAGIAGWLLGLAAMVSLPLLADSVPMRDYNLLSRGMNEGEVLYRLGPPDHQTVAYGAYDYILGKTWFYFPAPHEVSNRQWITEIHFDSKGRVSQLERYKAWGR